MALAHLTVVVPAMAEDDATREELTPAQEMLASISGWWITAAPSGVPQS